MTTTDSGTGTGDGAAALRRLLRDLLAGLDSLPAPVQESASALLSSALPDMTSLAGPELPVHGPELSYGLHPLHTAGGLRLQLIELGAGDCSALHGPGDGSWLLLRCPAGIELAHFELNSGLLSTLSRGQLEAESLLAVQSGEILQFGNPGARPLRLLLLHPLAATGHLSLRQYDLDEGRSFPVRDAAHFLAGPEEGAPGIEALTADFPSWLRHNVELLSRIARLRDLPGRSGLSTREGRLLGEFNSVDTWQALRQEMRIRVPGLSPQRREAWLRSLTTELAAAGALFARLHDEAGFVPSEAVLELIGGIIATLEQPEYLEMISGD